eukprot:gene2907-3492_t
MGVVDAAEVAAAVVQATEAIAPTPLASVAEASPEGLSLKLGYRIQAAARNFREGNGDEWIAQVIGYKVGCTSPVVRQQIGLTHPVRGYLWACEQHANGARFTPSSFRSLAIEGELGLTLLSTEGPPSEWQVEYMPVIELHHASFDCPSSKDRAGELVARNCIHAGVVRCAQPGVRCRLSEVPLDTPMVVSVAGQQVEAPCLRDLVIGGLRGPLATVSWLHSELPTAAGPARSMCLDGLFCGDFLLTATPGSLVPVPPGAQVDVQFGDLSVSCSVDNTVTEAVW